MNKTSTLQRPHTQGETHRLALLQAIRTLNQAFVYPPTLKDLAAACHLDNPGHARYYLLQLRDAGLVTFLDGRHGTIRLSPTGTELLAKFATLGDPTP